MAESLPFNARQEAQTASGLSSRAAVLVFLLALGARLAATAHFGFETLRFGDARAYLFAATELVRTGHYPHRTDLFGFRAPGYPLFLVLATGGRPGHIAAVKVANDVVGALAVLVLAALAGRLFRIRRAAILTGVAAAIHPGFLSLSADVQSEPLFLLLLLAAGFLLLAASDRPSSNLALSSGAALAAAALTRPSALILVPLLAAPMLDVRYPRRARVHLAASAAAGFCLLLAPWTLRNALVYREFVPIDDEGGGNFYQGNSDWTVRFYEVRTPGQYKAWSAAMLSDMEEQTRAAEAASLGSPTATSRFLIHQALQQRRGDRAGWLRLELHKTLDWLRPYPNPMFWPAWIVWSVGLFTGALTLLAAAGMAMAPRFGATAFVLVYLSITMLFHVVMLVVWRYRIPYWDPVILLYGAFGAAELLRRNSKRLPMALP